MSDPTGSCPCNYTTPCRPTCTCAHPELSGGCDRCCSYGSLEQRRAVAERIAQGDKDRSAYTTALRKINAIRNSIVGLQGFNFSEHAYPLVAALNEAGIEGLPYPEARANLGTLLEQRDEAVRRADKAEKALSEAEAEAVTLPHPRDTYCPTYYDGCHCLPETTYKEMQARMEKAEAGQDAAAVMADHMRSMLIAFAEMVETVSPVLDLVKAAPSAQMLAHAARCILGKEEMREEEFLPKEVAAVVGGPHNSYRIQGAHWGMRAVGVSLAETLRKPDGSGFWNSVEGEVTVPEAGPVVIIVQRVEGKTPITQVHEAQAERDEAILRADKAEHRLKQVEDQLNHVAVLYLETAGGMETSK